jgi:Protein of unknown function (DUF1311).
MSRPHQPVDPACLWFSNGILRSVRRSIGILLSLAIIAGCSGGARALTAATPTRTTPKPHLSPPFLPTSDGNSRSVADFPCPKQPLTTVDIEACSARRLFRLNARANDQINLIWSRLATYEGGAAVGRGYFVKAERAWRTYAANECTSRSTAWLIPSYPHLYVGGSSAGIHYGACMEQFTAAHINELKETAYRLGHGWWG